MGGIDILPVVWNELTGVTNEVFSRLMYYSWPGNIRELEHAIEHGFVLCHDKAIGLDHIPIEIRNVSSSKKVKTELAPDADKAEILKTLEKTDGNKAKAARILGIDRGTLYRKLSRYQLGEDLL